MDHEPIVFLCETFNWFVTNEDSSFLTEIFPFDMYMYIFNDGYGTKINHIYNFESIGMKLTLLVFCVISNFWREKLKRKVKFERSLLVNDAVLAMRAKYGKKKRPSSSPLLPSEAPTKKPQVTNNLLSARPNCTNTLCLSLQANPFTG